MARYAPLALAALLATACGTATPRSQAPTAARQAAAFKGSPAPLAALHAQANELLGGGVPGFRSRVRSLRGYPIVVNKWASWCGPCQTEFPAFQEAALRYGRSVAFMGVDGKDAQAAAASFLRRLPVSYPSYQDPDENIARSIQASVYFPQTVYFDRRGRIVYDHTGAYETAAALERDIQRYVLR